MRRFVLAMSFLMLWAVPVHAQQPFTQAELDKFLVDFPATAKYMEAKGQEIEAKNQPDAWKGLSMNREFVDFIGARGWSTERFVYVAQQVTSGIVAEHMAEAGPQLEAEFKRAKDEIMRNPDMTPEMKKQYLASLEQSMGYAKASKDAAAGLSPSELALVKANRSRIVKALEIEE